jgi:hypothetical protein
MKRINDAKYEWIQVFHAAKKHTKCCIGLFLDNVIWKLVQLTGNLNGISFLALLWI